MKKLIAIVVLPLLLAACGSQSTKSSNSSYSSNSASMSREDKLDVFNCFMQFEYMLFGAGFSFEDISKQYAIDYFIKEDINEDTKDYVADITRRNINEAMNYIYKNVDEESIVTAILGSVEEGFYNCLDKRGIKKNKAINIGIKLSQNITIITILKNKGVPKREVIDLYGEDDLYVTEGWVDDVFNTDKFNAGEFRLDVWELTLDKL